MAIEKRDELIRSLYKDVIGEEPYKQESAEKRFHDDTNTLMNGGTVEIKSARRHEMCLDEKEYAEIIIGNRLFMIVKDDGYLMGDVVAFVELAGFRQTGNTTLRNLTFIDKTSIGLKEGYCAIGWK